MMTLMNDGVSDVPYTENHHWPSPGLSDPVGRSGFAPEDRPEERLEDLGGWV